MSLPSECQVLVVGAGPTGLTAAIALAKLGVQVAIVDASSANQNGSRAGIVHARTLEVLNTIGLAQPLVEAGIKCERIHFRGTTNTLLEVDLSQLRDVTEFPFSMLIPQYEIERVFREWLAARGVQLLRNKTVVGMRESDISSGIEVTFEDGSVTRTQHVIGADGSRSTIRRLAGIGFDDPHTGVAYDDSTVSPSFHMVLADVHLEDPLPKPISLNTLSVYLDNFLLLVPLRSKEGTDKHSVSWRIGYATPVGKPKPPRNPTIEYLQQQIDERNPWDTRITIASVNEASSYRVRAAVASSYFQKIGDGNILLVGDAAHVHSPVGGQGMNLGICDAVAVAHAIQSHVESKTPEERDEVLQRYADSRRKIGVRVVGMTRGMSAFLYAGTGWWWIVRNLILRLVGYLPFLNRLAAWRLSGLVNRDG